MDQAFTVSIKYIVCSHDNGPHPLMAAKSILL